MRCKSKPLATLSISRFYEEIVYGSTKKPNISQISLYTYEIPGRLREMGG